MIKAIFFDMFNVVIKGDFFGTIDEYEKRFKVSKGEFYGTIHDFDGWKEFSLGKITQEEFYKRCSDRAINFRFDGDYFFELLKKNIQPNREMINFIKLLSQNYIIGIISNSPKEWYEALIEKTNLQNTIKVKAISGYLHARKPGSEIFIEALKRAGAKGNQAIYVDDRGDRIEGALKLGIKVVVFDGNMKKFKEKMNIYLNNS